MRSIARTMLIIAAVSATPAFADEQYKVDAVHSSVVFRVKHMGVSYCYGRFNKVSGTFHLDELNPAESTLDVSVDVSSIDTANEKRDEHLRKADFFDAEKFPTIRFQGTKVSRNNAGTFKVDGNLTLHGVTRPVTVEIEATGSGKGTLGETRSGLEGIFSIRRSEFGMDQMIGPVADDVRLMVSLEGIRQ